jgi:hypothetical protein
MLDHLALSVPRDSYQAVLDFYTAALAPLGYEKLVSMFDDKLVGLGSKASPLPNKADFWLSGLADFTGEARYTHWAFVADGWSIFFWGDSFSSSFLCFTVL